MPTLHFPVTHDQLQRFIDHGWSALFEKTDDPLLDVTDEFEWIKNDGATLVGRVSRRPGDVKNLLRLLHGMMINRLTAFVHIDQVGRARITSIGAWSYDRVLGWFCDVTFRKS